MFVDFIQLLKDFRCRHPHNLISSHLNVNTIDPKFIMLEPLFIENLVDVMFFSETKLAKCSIDDSNNLQLSKFTIKGFNSPIRKDRDIFGGGLMLITRDDRYSLFNFWILNH